MTPARGKILVQAIIREDSDFERMEIVNWVENDKNYHL